MKKYRWSVCFILFLLAASCAINPVTGKRELSLISEATEISLGQNTDVEIRQLYGAYNDPALTNYVNRIGQKLVPHTHRSHLSYHFAILDTPVVNAFAVPGGYIYVTRGILAMMNSEAELAVVLGHELGHVNARHSVRKMSKLMLVQLGMAVGSALSDTIAKISGVASIGIQLLFLKYSRDDERQADQLGIEYSRSGGYNPGEMIFFFSTLQALGDLSGGHSLPGFLSTHPLTSERIQNTKNQLLSKDKNLSIKQDLYMKNVQNLVYGDDPRQGYIEGNSFFHPNLQFVFSFPRGWKVQNSPSKVMLAPENGNAVLILQAEKHEGPLKNYAEKRAAKIEGRQFISDQHFILNGMNFYRQLYDIVQTNKETLRSFLYCIRKGSFVYTFSALSTAGDFDNYRTPFRKTIRSFKRLTNKSKLSRQPRRIKLIQANGRSTLQQTFKVERMEKDLWPKFAIMNRMNLDYIPQKGKLIKVVR